MVDRPAMLMAGTGPWPILFVSPVAERGGAETVLATIVRGLRRDRFQPIVAFLKEGPFEAELRNAGVETLVVPARRARYVRESGRAILALRRLVRARRIPLVFGNMAMGHVYGGLAALGTGAGAVWFQHGVPRRHDPLVWISAAVPARAVYVPSHPVEAFQASLRPRRRVERMHHGIDETRFDPTRYPRGAFRRALGVPEDAPLVVSVGRFQRGKGQHVFLEAAAMVRERMPVARFFLVGDTQFGLEPDYGVEVKARARALGPSGEVRCLGFRDDVPRILRDADVLVLPSILPEGSPVAVIEAMAMAVPVVATSVGGVPELVTDGMTGRLVRPGDARVIADAVLALLADPSRRAEMGRAARGRALAGHAASAMVERLEASFLRLLAGTAA